MVSLDNAILASYDKEGKHFELYVDPKNTYLYLDGSKKDLKNILVVEEVYENAKKAERAKSSDLQKAFGTTDITEILELVLRKGTVQLTTEQRKKKVEEKRKKIIDMICREAIDVRTKAPIPPMRIENAMEEVRFHVDPFKDPKVQMEELLKKLRPLIPIKFEKIQIAVKIPAEHSHRAYGSLKTYGIKKEQWLKDGYLIAVVEIPAGMQGEFIDHMNKLTAGEVETKKIE
ncbi:ribosome assembly factor SBDS [Candidatus Micrarchaeota archaeon]|nr:ribosome assembly factor SBDS [Candidatus Micrarchaeota archaeon]MBD3418388.1 ribosome assembly factor SBDS [Candidatus Micrarchaeota archaeon]